jgi:hypothetical protein
MQKEKIVQTLVDFIEETKRKKIEYYGEYHEISLFSWSHSLRCKISNEYGIEGDINRILVAEAWNRTHPHRLYTIPPLTLDNPSLTYASLR